MRTATELEHTTIYSPVPGLESKAWAKVMDLSVNAVQQDGMQKEGARGKGQREGVT